MALKSIRKPNTSFHLKHASKNINWHANICIYINNDLYKPFTILYSTKMVLSPCHALLFNIAFQTRNTQSPWRKLVWAPWVDVRFLFKTAREQPVRGPGVWCDWGIKWSTLPWPPYTGCKPDAVRYLTASSRWRVGRKVDNNLLIMFKWVNSFDT